MTSNEEKELIKKLSKIAFNIDSALREDSKFDIKKASYDLRILAKNMYAELIKQDKVIEEASKYSNPSLEEVIKDSLLDGSLSKNKKD